MTGRGIDVSRWNGLVNYKAVKSVGIDYVIIQSGYGMETSQKDPYFEENYKRAKSAGLKIGIYHYSYAKSVAEAKREAKVCLSIIKGKTLDLPVYIDMEEDSLSYLGKSTLTKIAEEFCTVIKKAGYTAGVYANANWFRNFLDYQGLRRKYSIWLAQYGSKKDFQCDIWQYSDSGRIKENACNFDMNYVYKTPSVKVKVTKNSGLYPYPYNDPVGKTSVPVLTLKRGAVVQWIQDDKYGWSKVKYKGKEYYIVNSHLSRKGLSSYPKEILKKDTKVYVEKKGRLIKAKILKKGTKVNILCTILKGRYKGYDYLGKGKNRYYRK